MPSTRLDLAATTALRVLGGLTPEGQPGADSLAAFRRAAAALAVTGVDFGLLLEGLAMLDDAPARARHHIAAAFGRPVPLACTPLFDLTDHGLRGIMLRFNTHPGGPQIRVLNGDAATKLRTWIDQEGAALDPADLEARLHALVGRDLTLVPLPGTSEERLSAMGRRSAGRPPASAR